MKTKTSKTGMMLILFGLLLYFPLCSIGQTTIEIQVSPNVLNLQIQGQVVTVHTDIAYSLVEGASVEMNGIEIAWWKSDNQGNFVAKFYVADIVALPLNIGEYNKLTLEGIKTDGEEFIGTDDIMVVNNVPQGGKK